MLTHPLAPLCKPSLSSSSFAALDMGKNLPKVNGEAKHLFDLAKASKNNEKMLEEVYSKMNIPNLETDVSSAVESYIATKPCKLEIKGHLPPNYLLNMLQILQKHGTGFLVFKLFDGYPDACTHVDDDCPGKFPEQFKTCKLLSKQKIYDFCVSRDEAPSMIEQQILETCDDTVKTVGMRCMEFDDDKQKVDCAENTFKWRLSTVWNSLVELDTAVWEIWKALHPIESVLKAIPLDVEEVYALYALDILTLTRKLVPEELASPGRPATGGKGRRMKERLEFHAWRIAFDHGSTKDEPGKMDDVTLINWSDDKPGAILRKLVTKGNLEDVYYVHPNNGIDGHRLHPGSIISTGYSDNGLCGVTKSHVQGITLTYVWLLSVGCRQCMVQPLFDNGQLIMHAGGAPVVFEVIPKESVPYMRELIHNPEYKFDFMTGGGQHGSFVSFSTNNDVFRRRLNAHRVILRAGELLLLTPGSVACGMATGMAVLESSLFFSPCGLGASITLNITLYLRDLVAVVNEWLKEKSASTMASNERRAKIANAIEYIKKRLLVHFTQHGHGAMFSQDIVRKAF